MNGDIHHVIGTRLILTPGVVESKGRQEQRSKHRLFGISGELLGVHEEAGNVAEAADVMIADNGVAIVILKVVVKRVRVESCAHDEDTAV